MLTTKQVNDMIRLLKLSTLTDCSRVAHGLAQEIGRESAQTQFQLLGTMLELPPIVDKRDCEFTLVSVPDSYIPIIKMIREQLNCGLKEAKDMFDSRKFVVPADKRDAVARELKHLGATTSIQLV
jgi:ribosomal protein L7/L12